MQDFCIVSRFFGDLCQRLGKPVQGLLALRLGRLDHQRIMDDQGELVGRRVVTCTNNSLRLAGMMKERQLPLLIKR